MDFNTAMAKSVAWASTSFAVIAALSYTKEPLCLMALVLPLFVGKRPIRGCIEISGCCM